MINKNIIIVRNLVSICNLNGKIENKQILRAILKKKKKRRKKISLVDKERDKNRVYMNQILITLRIKP